MRLDKYLKVSISKMLSTDFDEFHLIGMVL